MRFKLTLTIIALLAFTMLAFARSRVEEAQAQEANMTHEEHKGMEHPGETEPESVKAVYRCPMHPDRVSDKPDRCPICGMYLEKTEVGSGMKEHPDHEHKAGHNEMSHEGTMTGSDKKVAGSDSKASGREEPARSGSTTKAKGEGKILYHCPMHPTYISDRPGECPICGMTLVKIEEEETMVNEELGMATVKISPRKQQLIGVRTALVERRHLEKVIRTVGKVDYDETRLAFVNTKISGWIEELFVDYTGQLVEKDQPLLTIYSPELVATQEEYRLSIKATKYLASSPFEEISSGADSLLESTKRRLLLWDITEEQIQELSSDGNPGSNIYMTIYSPIRGYVIHKTALKGKHVKPGEDLYRIADLSTVWVHADIYEYEVPAVRVGQEVTVTLTSYPGEVFTGRVTYIYPYLEPKTRTVKVRLEFPNAEGKLKPEMYGNVEIKIDLGWSVAVPDEAIMDTGVRQVVFIDQGDGMFEPREVRLGARADGYYTVLDGVTEGEKVVTSGNFLIDSESKLRAAIGAMTHQH